MIMAIPVVEAAVPAHCNFINPEVLGIAVIVPLQTAAKDAEFIDPCDTLDFQRQAIDLRPHGNRAARNGLSGACCIGNRNRTAPDAVFRAPYSRSFKPPAREFVASVDNASDAHRGRVERSCVESGTVHGGAIERSGIDLVRPTGTALSIQTILIRCYITAIHVMIEANIHSRSNKVSIGVDHYYAVFLSKLIGGDSAHAREFVSRCLDITCPRRLPDRRRSGNRVAYPPAIGADHGLSRHARVAAHGVGIRGDRRCRTSVGLSGGYAIPLERPFEVGVTVGIDLGENDVVLIPQGKSRAATSTSARSQRDPGSVRV